MQKSTDFAPWMLWLNLWHLQSQVDPQRPCFLPLISAACSLLTASERPVLHAESIHAAERIRGVRHQRPFVLERDGDDLRAMRADHLALALPPLPQSPGDGGGFIIKWHRGVADFELLWLSWPRHHPAWIRRPTHT